MRIDVKDIVSIKSAYVDVNLEISKKEMDFSLFGHVLVGSLSFEGQLTSGGDGTFFLTGNIKAKVRNQCARCLEPVIFPIETTLAAVFFPTGHEPENSDVYRYKGFTVDIFPSIRERFLLALPQRVLCREDCRGLCPVCGINRNNETCDCADKRTGVGSPFDKLDALLTSGRLVACEKDGGAKNGKSKT